MESFHWLAVGTLSGVNRCLSVHVSPGKSHTTPWKTCFYISGPQFPVMSSGGNLSTVSPGRTGCTVCINCLAGCQWMAVPRCPDAQVHIWEIFLSHGLPVRSIYMSKYLATLALLQLRDSGPSVLSQASAYPFLPSAPGRLVPAPPSLWDIPGKRPQAWVT